MKNRIPVGIGFAAVMCLAYASPAAAHHVMDGETPATWMQGLLSGLGHPVIGLDHFAALVAIGLLSAALGRPLVLTAAFILASLAGVGLHVAAIDFPASEQWVAGSVMVLGALVFTALRPTLIALTVLFMLSGAFHGYAYGESIVGAELAPLVAYLAGLATIQYVLSVGLAYVAVRLATRLPRSAIVLPRVAGTVIVAVGIWAALGF